MTHFQPAIPHISTLPPLELGSNEDVLKLLDSLYQQGGIPSVVKWAKEELQPGRPIVYKGRINDEDVETKIIYDRSIWLLDDQGQATDEAQLPPLTDENYGESEFFSSWSRPRVKEPFVLRLRTWVK
ncbi:MAG TPA: hypothetical protein VK184_07955 [Nostocaceae cyanobacterium]|nr:hypothetical protein [Nostocaceae cyanobacterium]